MMDIRPVRQDEMPLILGWARDEGWNPGLDDAAMFHDADPEGFLVGHIRGEPVAAISVVRQGTSYGFLGLYIVPPRWRRRGLGLEIWKAGMERLEGRVVGLDGVPEQQENYRLSGFEEAHQSHRYTGLLPSYMGRANVEPVGHRNLAPALSFDRKVAGVQRTTYIGRMLTDSVTRRSVAVVDGGVLHGLATARFCDTGVKIGPLLAYDGDVALQLISGLAPWIGRVPVSIDVPSPNHEGVKLVTGLGLKPVFQTARMYRGPAPKADISRCFGIATLELG